MDIDRQLRFEKVKLLYEVMPLAMLATAINASILAYFEWNVVDHTLLVGWLVALIIVSSGRLLLAWFYYRSRPCPEQACWERCFIIGTLFSGVVWGSASLLLFPENSLAHQLFLAFVIGGMCAGAVTSLSPLLFALFSFLLLTLTPLIISFVQVGTEMARSMGLMLLFFLLMLIAISFRIHRNIKQNIELRIQSERQESTIFQSKQEQKAVLDNAPVGIWLVGVDGKYRFVNKTFCDAVGVAESEFLSTTHLADLLGEEAAASCLTSDRECLAQDEPYLSRETLTLADGKEHLMEITKAKVRDETGRVTSIIGTALDITERYVTEEKLRILSQAVEQAGESIVITGREGTIEYVNPAFTKITGYASDEAIGNSPRILKSGVQDDAFYENLWKTISSGVVWSSPMVERRKDGNIYPAAMSIAPIFNDDGEITHYVGIQQDMTEHHNLEEQLRQSQKMEALGTLVGGIAHDFNNMLLGIAGNVFLAMDEIKDQPKTVEKLKTVEETTFKAAEMIKQLLLFSRKGQLVMQPFGMTSFLNNNLELIQKSIPENIDFHCTICAEELTLTGDATQLEQVVMNLLNNARDAVAGVPDPAIQLTLDEYKVDREFRNDHPKVKGDALAHIMVADNGSGITDENMKHIFEPFYTTKDVGEGTGLGLAMCYCSVQSHGGTIVVESSP
ncbi:MAG TPA: PAS domain S-box protein, partial [Mariprofundaceae bacterium]|nr:PAS domain S-box protein [Mariprofundaceae bacterium]